jgi:hypothetical protein
VEIQISEFRKFRLVQAILNKKPGVTRLIASGKFAGGRFRAWPKRWK